MPKEGPGSRANRLFYLAVAALALTQGGCLLIAAGCAGGAAAGYCYCNGKLCNTYLASLDDTWSATRTALADLAMPVLEEERQGTNGFIKSKLSDGDIVRIYLDLQESKFPADGPVTRVCVRVAAFGDHPASGRILDQIGVHLAPPAAGAASAVPPHALPTWTGTAPPKLQPPTTVEPPPLPKEMLPNPKTLPN